MTEKLKAIIGEELNYKQLCTKLNLPIKGGKSKQYQLKDIALYCNLQTLSNPTRYVVTEVYDKALLPSKSKFQTPIEILIMQLFKANDYQTLYITNSKLLEYMNLVNPNYRIIKNPKLRRKLPFETENLYDGANKSGEILMKWLNRALDKMDGVYLFKRRGFCLVKQTGEFANIENVPLDSDLEKQMLECQRQTFIKLNLQYDEKHKWIPGHMKAQYQALFDQEIRLALGGDYVGGFQVNVLTPNQIGMKEILSKYESQQMLNQESQRKISSTKQLNFLTGYERERLIKEIIAMPAVVNYQQFL